VLDAQRSNEKTPDADSWLLFGGTGYGGMPAKPQPETYPPSVTLVIEGETHVYTSQQKLPWPWSKPANISINGPVKFRVEREKLFVVDEDGREHTLIITKKVLKPRS